MTCIVGVIENGVIYVGGDSAGVAGSAIRIREDSKIFTKNGMIFGFTSSFRMGQIIRYSFVIPHQKESKDDYEYLCTDFISSLSSSLKENGYKDGGTFLLGYKNNLYRVDSDFQVAKNNFNYDACGCGEDYALGALYAMGDSFSPYDQVKKALSAASFFSAYVCPPYVIESLQT
jgi:ATP-dependent protease HslVU (ClpYQ) peptidase subunit